MNIPFMLPKDPVRIFDLNVPIITNGNRTTVFLTDDIQEPCVYDELLYLLQTAEKHQSFVLNINTGGGVLDSAIMLSSAIKNSLATVTANLAGSVASAGTMIALACDRMEIAPHTSFMVHYYSAHIQGKGSDIKQQQAFMERSLVNLFNDAYCGFLTNEELTKAVEGTDYWFDHIETAERWKLRGVAR